jgi:hypothetical protein
MIGTFAGSERSQLRFKLLRASVLGLRKQGLALDDVASSPLFARLTVLLKVARRQPATALRNQNLDSHAAVNVRRVRLQSSPAMTAKPRPSWSTHAASTAAWSR